MGVLSSKAHAAGLRYVASAKSAKLAVVCKVQRGLHVRTQLRQSLSLSCVSFHK